jgi:hypothetical protein
MKKIRLAIAGVGNCASSLLQGIEYYKHQANADSAGLMHPEIGGYRIQDVEVVAAFDVDMPQGRPAPRRGDLRRSPTTPPSSSARSRRAA